MFGYFVKNGIAIRIGFKAKHLRMAYSDSIYELLSKLCEHYSYSVKSSHNAGCKSLCNIGSRNELLKKLKERLYGILLKFNQQAFLSKSSSFVGFDEVDTLLAQVYILRSSRKFDEGNKLETLLNRLRKGLEKDLGEIKPCLRFLICLAGTGNASKLSFEEKKIPQIILEKDECCVFPSGPLLYGDSVYFRSDHHFMQYPREVFEQVLSFLPDEDATYQNDLFEMPPGYDVNGKLLFNVSREKTDNYGDPTEPLFGALFHKVRSGGKNFLSVQLKIPELSETFLLRPLDFKLLSTPVASIRKVSAETSSEDEGFIESPLSSTFASSVNEDIWDAALKTKHNSWFSWETIGCYSIKKEKPFLTEAGNHVVDMLHQAHLHELYLLNPSFVGITPITISNQCLLRAILNLLIGVPSEIFYFLQDKKEFTMRTGVHVHGLTPDSMKLMLLDFIKAGTEYHRLELFSSESELKAHSNTGLVLQAFKGGLNQYLHYYQAAVLSWSQREFTLLQLSRIFRPLMKQIRFLAKLCLLNCTDENGLVKILPMGVELLSYLYQCTLEQSGHDLYLVMIFLLRSASLPYLKFLHEWLFEGICNDPFGEFHVQSNDSYLNAKDDTYWTKGYLLSSSDINRCVPPFLHHMASDIFICGKSLNLLKLCCPKHHLNHNGLQHPPVMFTFSEKTVTFITEKSKEYFETMKKIAIQQHLKVQHQQEEQKLVKLSLRHQAQKKRAEYLAAIQKKLEESKKTTIERKHQHLLDLKAQIIRCSEFQQQKKHDIEEENEKKIIDHIERNLIEDIEKEIRKEYSKKISEAEQYLLRAQWRTHRYQLHKERIQFWKNDEIFQSATSKCVIEAENMTEKTINTDNTEIVNSTDFENSLSESVQSRTMEEKKEYNEVLSEHFKEAAEIALSSDSSVETTIVLNVATKDPLKHADISKQIGEKEDSKINDESKYSAEFSKLNSSEIMSHSKPNRDAFIIAHKDDHIHIQSSEIVHHAKENILSINQCEKIEQINSVVPKISNIENNEENFIKYHSSVKGPIDQIPTDFISNVSRTDNGKHNLEICLQSKNRLVNNITVSSEVLTSEDTCSELKNRNKKKVLTFYEQTVKDEQLNKQAELYSECNKEIWGKALLDNESNTILKLRGRNIHGHSSDSTIQNLIYGHKMTVETGVQKKTEENKDKIEPNECLKDIILQDILTLSSKCAHPYEKNFSILGEFPLPDLVSNLPLSTEIDSQDSDEDISCCQYNFLPALLHRCLLPPLLAQIRLVNKSVVDYFMVIQDINTHFIALRNFFFFQDGEFGQSLSHLLFEKVSCCQRPYELLNPLTLSSILTQALAYSIYGDHPLADNLSFAIKSVPLAFPHNVSGILNSLELRYKVDWPCNIIITEQNIDYYNKIFGLLLQVKRALWSLNNIWFHLKRTAGFYGLDISPQYRQLQLFRHEMQHFARVVQSYIASQILQVTWQEFQRALHNKVHTLDDLREAHANYLKRACFRCLLSRKAAPVMKIIQDIFNLILKFHSKLIVSSWQMNLDTGQLEHPSFHSLVASYKIFKQYSGFLYKVMKKLVARRYQLHLQDFLEMFDFNDYYLLEENYGFSKGMEEFKEEDTTPFQYHILQMD